MSSSILDIFGAVTVTEEFAKQLEDSPIERVDVDIDKKTGTIRYNAGQSYDADRIIKELPETLEPRKSREWVIMNLDEAREFFGIDFRMTWLDKMRKG